MCDDVPLTGCDGEIPLSIQSDDPLFNVGKRELSLALSTAHNHPWVADWLFKNPSSPIHDSVLSTSLPPRAFDNSLVLNLHHDISTPSLSSSLLKSSTTSTTTVSSSHPSTSCNNNNNNNNDTNLSKSVQRLFTSSKDIVSKDIDIMLIPLKRSHDITIGYAFLQGISESTFSHANAPHTQNNQQPLMFCRFSFHHSENHLTVVITTTPGKAPIMGIMTIKHLSPTARERGFFIVPNAEYGAGNLPSRVLSMQSNVDYVVPIPDDEDIDDEELINDYDENINNNNTNPSNNVHESNSMASIGKMMMNYDNQLNNTNQSPYPNNDILNLPPVPPPQHQQQQSANANANVNVNDLVQSQMNAAANVSLGLNLNDANQVDMDVTNSMAPSLSLSMGTTPIASSSALPDVVSDQMLNYMDTNDLYNEVLNDDTINMPMPMSMNVSGDLGSISQLGTNRNLNMSPDRLNELLFVGASTVDQEASPDTSPCTSTSEGTPNEMHSMEEDEEDMEQSVSSEREQYMNEQRTAMGEHALNASLSAHNGWVTSSKARPNDGSSLNSESFDMKALRQSVRDIERSCKGTFFGPKVHKDIMHPYTGELVSRRSGEISARLKRVDENTWQFMKLHAIQSYYANVSPILVDSLFASAQSPLQQQQLRALQQVHAHQQQLLTQQQRQIALLTTQQQQQQQQQHLHQSSSPSSSRVSPQAIINEIVSSSDAAIMPHSKKQKVKPCTTNINNLNSINSNNNSNKDNDAIANPRKQNNHSNSSLSPSSSTPTPTPTTTTTTITPTPASIPSVIQRISQVQTQTPTQTPTSVPAPVTLHAMPTPGVTKATLLAPRPILIAPNASIVPAIPVPVPVPVTITDSPPSSKQSPSIPAQQFVQPQDAAAAFVMAAAVQQHQHEQQKPSEELLKVSKMEEKRIKNRLSAAKSNHKRRVQLEAQKKELAVLRKRVEELKSKKELVKEENESLKKKVAQESAAAAAGQQDIGMKS